MAIFANQPGVSANDPNYTANGLYIGSPIPVEITSHPESLSSTSGASGGYTIPLQFGPKPAYPNDVALPVYDPNTMRPSPFPHMVDSGAEMRRRKRLRRRAEAVALALLLLEDYP